MSWKSVWKTIHSPGKSSDHVNLDFKIAHIILTYSKLFKYGLVPSRLCPVCLKEEEDICHLFLYCDELYNLISVFNEMCICAFKKTEFSLEYLKSLLLFGCYRKIQNCTKDLFNILLSIYRISVFKRRLIAEQRSVNINIVTFFKHYMRQHFMLLFNHYGNQNRSSVFIAKYIDNNKFLMLNNKELVFKYPLEN